MQSFNFYLFVKWYKYPRQYFITHVVLLWKLIFFYYYTVDWLMLLPVTDLANISTAATMVLLARHLAWHHLGRQRQCKVTLKIFVSKSTRFLSPWGRSDQILVWYCNLKLEVLSPSCMWTMKGNLRVKDLSLPTVMASWDISCLRWPQVQILHAL